jgi:hypothetical protein
MTIFTRPRWCIEPLRAQPGAALSIAPLVGRSNVSRGCRCCALCTTCRRWTHRERTSSRTCGVDEQQHYAMSVVRLSLSLPEGGVPSGSATRSVRTIFDSEAASAARAPAPRWRSGRAGDLGWSTRELASSLLLRSGSRPRRDQQCSSLSSAAARALGTSSRRAVEHSPCSRSLMAKPWSRALPAGPRPPTPRARLERHAGPLMAHSPARRQLKAHTFRTQIATSLLPWRAI